jgi:hypothetical protein
MISIVMFRLSQRLHYFSYSLSSWMMVDFFILKYDVLYSKFCDCVAEGGCRIRVSRTGIGGTSDGG